MTQRGGVSSTSRAGRVARLAWRGAAEAASSVAHKGRIALAPQESVPALEAARRSQTATEVARLLGVMKGLAMKLGQSASYAQAGMSDEWKEALSALQQDAPPMPRGVVLELLEAELGPRARDLVDGLEPDPFAAASIGQVHRVVTRDGQRMAVKVQYPDAEAALKADIDALATLVRTVSLGGDKGDSGGVSRAMQEFRQRMVQETDYEREADNVERFRAGFRDHPFIYVPRVFPELTTRRVLTMEMVDGARFHEAVGWPQEQRDLAGEAVYRFFMQSLFRLGTVHADPHPGNYLFHGDGRVTVLDFGAVWQVPPQFHDDIEAVMALRREPTAGPHDPEEQVRATTPFRWLFELLSDDRGARPAPVDEDASPWLVAEPAQYDHLGESAMRMSQTMSVLHHAVAAVARLGAVGDWGRIARELSPRHSQAPHTVLGVCEAVWLRSRPNLPVDESFRK